MRVIISRSLYIFYPIFKDHFFVFKEVFSENSVLIYGLYSREAYDGLRMVVQVISKSFSQSIDIFFSQCCGEQFSKQNTIVMIIIFSFSVAPFIAWEQRLESRNSTVSGWDFAFLIFSQSSQIFSHEN